MIDYAFSCRASAMPMLMLRRFTLFIADAMMLIFRALTLMPLLCRRWLRHASLF